MLHARSDYDRIQDPATEDPTLLGVGCSAFAQDEPVFIVRAKDQAFVATVNAWIISHEGAGGDPEMVAAVRLHIERAKIWQEKNPTQIADAPISSLRCQGDS